MENNSQPQKNQPWCKRAGSQRICLICNRSTASNPDVCASPQHQETYRKRLERGRNYWVVHKQQLVEANRKYRAKHPELKEKNREYQKRHYNSNRAKKLAQGRTWDRRNPEKRRLYSRKWHAAHPEHSRANWQRYYRNNKTRKNHHRGELLKAARAINPGQRARLNLRSRLAMLIHKKGPKTFSIRQQVFLYTASQLRVHLESQFAPAMNWENYGKVWEIDHIIPCKKYDLTVLEQAIACFALSNLRPLLTQINRSSYHTDKRNCVIESGVQAKLSLPSHEDSLSVRTQGPLAKIHIVGLS